MKKYDIIYTTLEREIKTGKYMFGFRLPSDLELGKRFSASRPTIARALGELESVGLVERKVGSGTFVNFHAPTTRKRYKLGLLVPGLGETEIFDQICGQLSHLAQTENFKLLWYGSMDSGPEERAAKLEQLANSYIEEKIDGVFFAPLELTSVKDTINQKISNIFRKNNIAVVLMDRDILPFPQRSQCDLVSIDHFRAAFIVTRHFIELGRKNIHFLSRPFSAPSVEMRIAGCREAVRIAGLPFGDDHIHILDSFHTEDAQKVNQSQPDAILCANDSTAAKFIQALNKAKIDVPEQIMVAGIDDLPYSKYLSPTLTTYRQPQQELARIALKTMVDRIENEELPPRTIQLTGKLIVRQSSLLGTSEKS